MATSTSSAERTATIPRRPGRRRTRSVRERLTGRNLLAVGASLLTFVLIAAALQDRRATVTVAVAARDIPAGTQLTPDLVRLTEVPASVPFAAGLVRADRLESGGLVAIRTVLAGEPLVDAAVGSGPAGAGQRVMSIPLAAEQAADGRIEVGDRIDVIQAGDDGARYVLVGAEVIGRSSSGGGGIVSAGSGDLVLSVVVDDQQALAVAAALHDGELTAVRSTGAPPPAAPAVPALMVPTTAAGG